MANFADQIQDLLLYRELLRPNRKDNLQKTDRVQLAGLVVDVTNMAGSALAQVPAIFKQYTVHDIRHCRNVIERMGDIIPEDTLKQLNGLEITFLLLSALLHDIGMVVSDQEKSDTLLSESFRRFREEGYPDRNEAINAARSSGDEPRARAIEDALLAEYYRRLHPERVSRFIQRNLPGRIRFQDIDFSEDISLLCESHAWGVEDSNDPRHPEKSVRQLDDNARIYGTRVNIQYIACILRLADILDFDRSRTPLIVFQHLDFTESKSWEEWNKHLLVKGWEITPAQVAFDIPCTHPVFYVAVHEFLGWIDEELRQCRYLVENKPQPTAHRYKLLLPQIVDRHKVRMADTSYIAGGFRFQLEYENILQLLMDKSLYPDPSLFLRELLQNALDACRRKEAAMEMLGLSQQYTPCISVLDLSDDPSDPRILFQDNGIGMSQRIVEHYFLRIGKSYYRSPEFDAERIRMREHGKELDACSQFGIGILSCFLAGDRFEVETFQEGHEPLHIFIEGPAKYFLIKRLPLPDRTALYSRRATEEEDTPPHGTGTRITVHLRPGIELDTWQTLETFAVNVEYPISVAHKGSARTIPALRWGNSSSAAQHLLFRPGRRLSVTDPDLEYLEDLSRESHEMQGLERALVASYIPFSSWPFSAHIRGRSWFWLLQGHGKGLTPQAGFLKVGLNLELAGPPAFISALERAAERSQGLQSTFEELLLRAESRDDYAYDNFFGPLLDDWYEMSEDEQDFFSQLVSERDKVLKGSPKVGSWLNDPTVVESLLKGSLDWAWQPVDLSKDAVSNTKEDQMVALHSILVPAGVVQWDVIKAKSRTPWLLPLLGRLQFDVRGLKSPRPAAHRLFIPDENFIELRQDYLRAALRHGADLCSPGTEGAWREWFGQLVSSAFRLGLDRETVMRLDSEFIEERCRLAVFDNGLRSFRGRREILSQFGERVPLLWWGWGRGFGLVATDPVNRLFVRSNPSLEDGAEVDISHYPFELVEK